MNAGLQAIPGIVVIGRNEGVNLERCLTAIRDVPSQNIVYVDSGSTDGSVDLVKGMNINVIELDTSIPFSAGRARNEGLNYLLNKDPGIQYVQFIDGDCILDRAWLAKGINFLQAHESYAIVAGRVREAFPDKSFYNFLCDIEWDTPAGDVDSCGGIFLARVDAFNAVGGFNQTVVAGEEPELCFRLRRCCWKIYRLQDNMAVHDAAMFKFSQWFFRMMRGGHAYAQVFWLHGWRSPYFCLKNCARIWFWTFGVIVGVICLSYFWGLLSLLLLTVYFLSFIRMSILSYRRFSDVKTTCLYVFFLMLGKWPQVIGQILFFKRLIFKQHIKIVESVNQ